MAYKTKNITMPGRVSHQESLAISKEKFVIFIKHRNYHTELYPYPNLKSMEKCEKKYPHEIRKHSLVIVLQSQIFTHIEAAGYIKRIAWINKASEAQKHLAIFYSPYCTKKVTGPKRIKTDASSERIRPFFIFTFGAFFQPTNKSLPIKSRRGAGAILRHVTSLYYYGCLTFVTKKRKAIASCTFAVYFLCTKKGTGLKRKRSNVLPLCCSTFFLFAFGAFLFWHLFDRQNIDGRRGAGAIYGHVISLYYYGCLTFVTKKRKAIASCTFAVFFFFLFYAPNECLIHTQKNSKWREYVST